MLNFSGAFDISEADAVKVEHSLLKDSSAESDKWHATGQADLSSLTESENWRAGDGDTRNAASPLADLRAAKALHQISAATAAGRSAKLRTFRCRHCEFQVQDKVEFWRHARLHIKPDKILECKQCEFVTEYRHHLEYHERNHRNQKPFQCDKCSYRCVNRSMLNSHMKSHSSVCHYRCLDCAYATKYCHSLKTHLRKHGHRPAPGSDKITQQLQRQTAQTLSGCHASAFGEVRPPLWSPMRPMLHSTPGPSDLDAYLQRLRSVPPFFLPPAVPFCSPLTPFAPWLPGQDRLMRAQMQQSPLHSNNLYSSSLHSSSLHSNSLHSNNLHSNSLHSNLQHSLHSSMQSRSAPRTPAKLQPPPGVPLDLRVKSKDLN